MKIPAALVLTVLLAGCATTRSQMLAESEGPAGPVDWPVGTYTATARLDVDSNAGASVRGWTVNAEFFVDPDGTVYMTSGEGACWGGEERSPGRRVFACGSTGFELTTDGETINGSAWGSSNATVDTGRQECTSWDTDEQGRRTCTRWTKDAPKMSTVRGRGRLHVTRRD